MTRKKKKCGNPVKPTHQSLQHFMYCKFGELAKYGPRLVIRRIVNCCFLESLQSFLIGSARSAQPLRDFLALLYSA